jgi:hypothetical protein
MRIVTARILRFAHEKSVWLSLIVVVCLLAANPARATTVIAPDFNSLVSGADYVVRAAVKSVTSEYRTTPQGRAIFTKVELQVLETITGTPPQPLVLQLLGGTADGVTMRVEGVPQFRVGDEDILFVQNNGTQFYPLVGIMNGKFPVKYDAVTGTAYVARSNGVPLYDEKDVKQEMGSASAAQAQHPAQQPLSPEAFATKIREAHNNQVPPKPPSLAN